MEVRFSRYLKSQVTLGGKIQSLTRFRSEVKMYCIQTISAIVIPLNLSAFILKIVKAKFGVLLNKTNV